MFQQAFRTQNQNAAIRAVKRTWFDQAEMRMHAAANWPVLNLPEQVVVAWAWFKHDIRMIITRVINQQIDGIAIINGFRNFAIAAFDGGLIACFLERVDIIQNVFLKGLEPGFKARARELVAQFLDTRLQDNLCRAAPQAIKGIGDLFFEFAGRQQCFSGLLGDLFKRVFGFVSAFLWYFVK